MICHKSTKQKIDHDFLKTEIQHDSVIITNSVFHLTLNCYVQSMYSKNKKDLQFFVSLFYCSGTEN